MKACEQLHSGNELSQLDSFPQSHQPVQTEHTQDIAISNQQLLHHTFPKV